MPGFFYVLYRYYGGTPSIIESENWKGSNILPICGKGRHQVLFVFVFTLLFYVLTNKSHHYSNIARLNSNMEYRRSFSITSFKAIGI